jgi:hypothetical protein
MSDLSLSAPDPQGKATRDLGCFILGHFHRARGEALAEPASVRIIVGHTIWCLSRPAADEPARDLIDTPGDELRAVPRADPVGMFLRYDGSKDIFLTLMWE